MSRMVTGPLRRAFHGRASGRRVARRSRLGGFRLEALEGRALLSAVNFAEGFGAGGPGSPTSGEAVATDANGSTFLTGGFSGTVKFGPSVLTSAGASNVYVMKINPGGTGAWARQMGGSSSFFGDYGRGIAVDKAGNVYVTGYFYGPGNFGPFSLAGNGNRDVFVVKLDNNGNFKWAKNFGGSGSDLGQSVAVDDAGNVYVTGSFQNAMQVGSTTLTSQGFNDGFVLKLDTNGKPVWARSFGGSDDDSGFTIAVDRASGAVYTTGDFNTTAQFGNGITRTSRGDYDGFVMAMNNAGNTLWVDDFGGSGHDDGTGVAVDGAGHVYATGDFSGTATLGGAVLNSAGGSDIYLARLDAAGNVVWARGYGAGGQDAGFGVTTDPAGDVYATGYFQGSFNIGSSALASRGGTDGFLALLDPNGNVLSAQGFGSSGNDQGQVVSVGGPQWNITVAGDYAGPPLAVSNTSLPTSGTAFAIQFVSPVAMPVPKWPSTPSDLLNLGYTQPATFRPSDASWSALGPSGTQSLPTFGTPGLASLPVAADFDGTGHTEEAVFVPATAQWYALNPNTGSHLVGTFGAPGLFDIPVPGHYDGLAKAEMAVFRPSTAQWFVDNPTTGGHLAATFGAPNLTDIPVPGDYDGTGHTEIAVFRPSTAQWFILRPNGGQLLTTFGAPNLTDIPIPGDWDHVGHTEVAVYRPSTSQIFVLGPNGGHLLTTFGAPNLAAIPTQANAGALLRLGLIHPGGSSSSAAAFSPSGLVSMGAFGATSSATGAMTSNPAAGSGTTSRPTAATAPSPVQLGGRSAVVLGQGSPATSSPEDVIAAALDGLAD